MKPSRLNNTRALNETTCMECFGFVPMDVCDVFLRLRLFPKLSDCLKLSEILSYYHFG